MLSQVSRLLAIMLGFLFGFAVIRAEEIPDGVMPKKRQVAGTGVTTTSSAAPTTSSAAQSTSQAASSTPQTTSQQPTTSQQSSVSQQTSQQSSAPSSNTGSSSAQQSSQPPSSTSIPTTVAITTTNSDGSTVTSSISTDTLAAASSSSAAVQTESGSSNSVVKLGTSTINPATLSHKTTAKVALVTSETRHSTYTSYWTSDGQRYSSVYTTENVFASTTGFATATIAPSLANGGGNGSNLSTNSKSIIGGVVGGIGGALLLGGLAFVAWRLWGKKKREQMNDDMYDGSQNDSIHQQKRESNNMLGREYSNPGGRVNTASNF